MANCTVALSFTRIATATADYSTRRPLLRRLQWARLYWAEHIDMMGFQRLVRFIEPMSSVGYDITQFTNRHGGAWAKVARPIKLDVPDAAHPEAVDGRAMPYEGYTASGRVLS